MDFTPSAAFSVGMELELQLLDPTTFDLAEAVLPLLETYSDHRYVKPEFLQNTVEVVSPVAADLSELEAGLRPLLVELLQHGDRLGLGLCGAGTHPFNCRPATYTPGARDGIGARLIASQDGELISLQRIAALVLGWVRPWAAADERPWLDRLEASIAAGLPYGRQRLRLRRGGGFREVVAALAEELRADLA